MVSSGDSNRLRIASRGSTLALWQSEHVRDLLRGAGVEAEIVVVRTTGDQIRDVPLSRIGDRGLFTREVDDALLDGRAELAVHSLKDVPTALPKGLEIFAVLQREDAADVLLTRDGIGDRLRDLPAGTRIGTSSLRRQAQLAALRPDLQVVDLRGNVDTRLTKVRQGDVDAAILARAGLLRLGLDKEASERLEPPGWLPAVGQGALAVVARTGATSDSTAAAAVARLDHAPTRARVTAERSFLARLEGGCQIPIGALATVSEEGLELAGGVFSLDGARVIRGSATGPIRDADAIGTRLAEQLLEKGAAQILEEIRARVPRPGVPAP